jgi:uncharacterized protein YbjT (DUF2867 family)
MTKPKQSALILGGSGRTGSLIARQLTGRGAHARTASRHGSDLLFDWDDPGTHANALEGVDRVYLVTPTMRVRYVDPVAKFFDLAEAASVAHVTLLSAYNGNQAPQGVDVAAVEVEVASRGGFTHTILRPAWVMQNFTDAHLPIGDGASWSFRAVVVLRRSSTPSTSQRSRLRPSCIPPMHAGAALFVDGTSGTDVRRRSLRRLPP